MSGKQMENIRGILIDAAGTLLHPSPSVGEIYAEFGRKFGSRHDAATLKERFKIAFQRQEAYDREHDHQTDRAREYRRWQTIVAEALDDVHDPAGCFEALYHYFAKPEAWCIDGHWPKVLERIRHLGLKVGIASNFDERLHSILKGWPELFTLDAIVISSEVGCRKPSPRFYEAAARKLQLPANAILSVGDDYRNDVRGAEEAGMTALHISPARSGLSEALDLLPQPSRARSVLAE